MKENKKKFVNPKNAKGSTYGNVLREIQTKKVCPFCPENFKWHTKPILKYKGEWFITENFNPYKNTLHHFLIVGKVHKEKFSDLTIEDWSSITNLVNWAIKEFDIKGCGVMMRFGNILFTGATVTHLHCHLIVPKIKNGEAVPVYFPIG